MSDVSLARSNCEYLSLAISALAAAYDTDFAFRIPSDPRPADDTPRVCVVFVYVCVYIYIVCSAYACVCVCANRAIAVDANNTIINSMLLMNRTHRCARTRRENISDHVNRYKCASRARYQCALARSQTSSRRSLPDVGILGRKTESQSLRRSHYVTTRGASAKTALLFACMDKCNLSAASRIDFS